MDLIVFIPNRFRSIYFDDILFASVDRYDPFQNGVVSMCCCFVVLRPR